MAKKILILRSVSMPMMGYVVKDTVNRFGSDWEITVLARPENAYALREMTWVKNTLLFFEQSFDLKLMKEADVERLKSHSFDTVVIPINGKPDSYDNVVKLCRYIFSNTPICYYNSSIREFFLYRHKVMLAVFKAIVKLISLLGALALTGVYLLGLIFFSIKGCVAKGTKSVH